MSKCYTVIDVGVGMNTSSSKREELGIFTCPQALNGINWDKARSLALKNGFEIHPDGQFASFHGKREELAKWPLIVFVYPSMSKDGCGRVCDCLNIVPARRVS